MRKVSFPGVVSWHSQVLAAPPAPLCFDPENYWVPLVRPPVELQPVLTQAQDCLIKNTSSIPSLFIQLLHPGRGENKSPGTFSFFPDLWNSSSVYHLLVNQESLLDVPLRNASSSLVHTWPVAKFSWKGFSSPLDNF